FYSTNKPHLPRCIRLHSTKECGAHAPCIRRFLANIPAFLTSQIHPKTEIPLHHKKKHAAGVLVVSCGVFRSGGAVRLRRRLPGRSRRRALSSPRWSPG